MPDLPNITSNTPLFHMLCIHGSQGEKQLEAGHSDQVQWQVRRPVDLDRQ